MEHQRRKKKIKKSTIIKIVVSVTAAAVILTGVVIYLQKSVKSKFAKSSEDTIKTATVETGSVSTTVYGKGRLKDDDVETQEVPDSVKLTELKVEVGDTVNKGDVIATADLSTVLSAMSETQASIDSLDKKIKSAADDEVSSSIKTTVAGRIKKIYAKVHELEHEFCKAFQKGPEQDYYQELFDRRMRQIFGPEDFVPFAERYDKITQPTYRKR